MDVNVSVRFVGGCVVPNDKGELEFESGAGTKTKLHAEEVHNRMLQAQSFEAALEYLQGSGAYIGSEGSRVLIVATPNGTQIFAKDEPSRKITVDRELPEQAIQQILSLDDFDNGRAVEKILIENRVIEDPKKEMEQSFTSDRDSVSFEREADNVDSRDVTDNGEIAAARLARDQIMENTYSGVYSEEQARMYEERRRQERELQERDGGRNRNSGMDR